MVVWAVDVAASAGTPARGTTENTEKATKRPAARRLLVKARPVSCFPGFKTVSMFNRFSDLLCHTVVVVVSVTVVLVVIVVVSLVNAVMVVVVEMTLVEFAVPHIVEVLV